MKGTKTMAEAIVVEMPTTQGFWAGMKNRLASWGSKIKGFVYRTGSYIKRAASWLWNTKAAQWVVAKAGFVAGKVWHVAKGPVGWVTAPILAIIFAPKAVAVMLFLVLLATAAVGLTVWQIWRHIKKVSTPEQIEEIKDELTLLREGIVDEARYNANGGKLVEDELDPAETIETRYAVLDVRMSEAIETADGPLLSELLGRIHLLLARSGKGGKIKKDATVSVIYRDCRKNAEHKFQNIQWNWSRMSNAVKSEDKRLKDTAELKAKRANLTSV
jgi:hypothetical protein